MEIVREIVEGGLGTAYASDYIFDEVVTLALVCTGKSETALSVGGVILGEFTAPFLVILHVDGEAFDEA